MSSEPILVIKDNDSTIGIRARVGEEFAEHEIQLNVILAYYWDKNLPVIENLIDLFESAVKRTINEVLPHENLFLKYRLIMDAEIDQASRFEIHLIEVKADDVSLRLDGKILALKGISSKEEYSKGLKDILSIRNIIHNEDNNLNQEDDDLISSEYTIVKLVEKKIPTEKKISFKEFAKQQKEKNNFNWFFFKIVKWIFNLKIKEKEKNLKNILKNILKK